MGIKRTGFGSRNSGTFSQLLSFCFELLIYVLRTGPIPKHIALIMDGNRRYARLRKLEIEQGHSAGAESLEEVRLSLRIPRTT